MPAGSDAAFGSALTTNSSTRPITITALNTTADTGAICQRPDVSPTAHRYRKAHGRSIMPTLMAYIASDTTAAQKATPCQPAHIAAPKGSR